MRRLLDADVQRRLWAHVEVAPTGCWEWRAARNSSGYGLFSLERGRQISAHRATFISAVGEIPEGYVIDHICRNPGCTNPAHLEAVTQKENVLRGYSPPSWNAIKQRCIRGHRFDRSNTYDRPDGGRTCRTCRRLAMRKLRNKRRSVSLPATGRRDLKPSVGEQSAALL